MLSTPLAYGSQEEWYAAAMRVVRGFFRGDSVFLCTPNRGARLYFEDDQPTFSDEFDPWIAYSHGEIKSTDAAFERGFVACRQRRLSTLTSTMIDQIIGNQLRHSVVYNDILRPVGVQVSVGCGGPTSFGESASSALAVAALAQGQEMSTARSRYLLRATLLPARTCATGPSVLVLARQLSAALPAAIELRARFGLTQREVDVALHLAAGMTGEAIARRIDVSSHTARHHSERVLTKLGLRSRKGLGLFLVHSCLDEPAPRFSQG